MLDAIVATLAVGRRYVDLAQAMAAAHVAAGNHVVVVTDEPAAFAAPVEALRWHPEAAHVWHSKRHAVRAGLERARTVYYMDADYVPQGPAPRLEALPAGMHSRMWRLPLVGISLAGAGRLSDPPAATWLTKAALALGVSDWRQHLPWWGDSLWAIAAGPGTERFCAAWDHFAEFTVAHPAGCEMLGGDGVALSFAACASGDRIHPRAAALRGLEAVFVHARLGAWRNLPLMGLGDKL